jgi:hypothetical protein
MGTTKEITLEEAQAVIAAHRDRENEARVAEARQYLGRYFRFLNSYGGGPDRPRWWLYAMPTDIDEYGTVTGLKFQHTENDTIEIQSDAYIGNLNDFVEISAAEFWDAASDLQAITVERLTRKSS